jgi:hypothetical protein
MERKKALIISAVIATTVMLGAVAVTANSNLLDRPGDNVGNLQATTTQPAEITVYVDPVTGVTSLTKPQATTSTVTPAPQAPQQSEREHDQQGGERDD